MRLVDALLRAVDRGCREELEYWVARAPDAPPGAVDRL